MIVDIDKKNNSLILMNILQLKWILYNQIQKKYYNIVLNNKMIKKNEYNFDYKNIYKSLIKYLSYLKTKNNLKDEDLIQYYEKYLK